MKKILQILNVNSMEQSIKRINARGTYSHDEERK